MQAEIDAESPSRAGIERKGDSVEPLEPRPYGQCHTIGRPGFRFCSTCGRMLTAGGGGLAAAEAGSVKRYLDFVVMVGGRDEYIVEDGLCTCDRFRIRNGFCRHRLAARIAVLAGLCEEYDLWYHAALD